MRMRAHIHAVARREFSRAHMILKHERADVTRQQHRQHASHDETIAQIVQARILDQGWMLLHVRISAPFYQAR
jgi:hypothetical protein